ncbi:WxcM-like domain-containing protein [Mesonia sp. K4-1]|uniref:WxcM-like domain-containing protein n=1 Tax=Mesonia sp. K4-1 TaxID=2602760 RepID=UPI0011C7C6A4|nr:WxcM-like domain-containing protein [Mesonia sp. K4-1]TXK77871.1 sugar epimerase [Mesonia sp. K4-1]
MREPQIIKGNNHRDDRGEIQFNNKFNAIEVKRIYTIENKELEFIRAWQGHKIEKRWFSVIQGNFEIKLIRINNWQEPDPKSEIITFQIDDKGLHILYVPPGFVTSIQALAENSKLLAMSDYMLGEVADEYRFKENYFTKL